METSGPGSLSAIVPVADAAVVESVRPAAPVSSTTTVSLASSSASSVTATAMVLVVSPAAKVSVPAARAV